MNDISQERVDEARSRLRQRRDLEEQVRHEHDVLNYTNGRIAVKHHLHESTVRNLLNPSAVNE